MTTEFRQRSPHETKRIDPASDRLCPAGSERGAQLALSQAVVAPVDSFAIPATDEGLPGEGPIRRADWFQDVWRQRRTGFVKSKEQDQGSLVFLGDSITQGWGAQLAKFFPGVQIANRGISGDTTRGMLLRLEDDVLSLNPRGVVLLMGTNDLEEGATPETIVDNIELIIEALSDHDPQMPIVLCQVFPSSAEKNRPTEQIQRINQLLAASVRGNPQVTLLETWPLFANQQGDAKPEEFPDLLHPNEAGYAKWAAALRPIFATLSFVETEPDSFAPEPGFTSLFNGDDLTGWCFLPTSEQQLSARARWQQRNPDVAPPWPIITEREDFAGLTASSDGRYVASNGRLVVTTPSEGRRIQQLWSTREFPEDFVLKLEFRATPNADSGVFIREPQLQCRDYLLAGPYTELKSYRPQEWNELIVDVHGDTARCTCNGEVLDAEFKVPPTGPIGLEGDRGQMEYRRIRIREGHSQPGSKE